MTGRACNVPSMNRHTTETPLDEALWAAKLNGVQLAGILGVNVSQVSRWRRGVNIPTHATQRRIAKALGVSVADLWPPA
jgi:DNA-binding transcriptional regulator YiaG